MNTNVLIEENENIKEWIKPYSDIPLYYKGHISKKDIVVKVIIEEILSSINTEKILNDLYSSDKLYVYKIASNDFNWKIPFIAYMFFNDIKRDINKKLCYAKLAIKNNIDLVPGNFSIDIQKDVNSYINKPYFKYKRFLKRLSLFINNDNMSLKNLVNFKDVNYLKTNDNLYVSWVVKDKLVFSRHGGSYIAKEDVEIELI